jgi:hypothetical protein
MAGKNDGADTAFELAEAGIRQTNAFMAKSITLKRMTDGRS